jgi:hypothetical protein
LNAPPPCEICAGPSRKELRGVEDRGRCVRNARSVAVDGRFGCRDPPQSLGGLPGRYGRRLLPICCPAAPDHWDHRLNRPAASSLPREREGQGPIHPGALGSIPDSISNMCSIAIAVGTWQDPDLGQPIAAPLERCAELLGIDLATVRELAAKLEPYVRADGTRIWSLMQLERQLRPETYGRRRGGYVDRRQT